MSEHEHSGVQLYERAWLHSLTKILAAALGPGVSACRAGQPGPDAAILASASQGLWLRFASSGALSGDQVLLIPPENAQRLATALHPRAPAGAPAEPLKQEHLSRFFAQVAAAAADILSEELGSAVEFNLAEGAGPALEPEAMVSLELVGAHPERIALYLMVSPELAAALRRAAAKGDAAPAAANVAQAALMERLMDAELEVALRFGERELLLKEVLELTPGAVIELDHLVDDPAELLIGGRVFARGQVVVVDGNYGLCVSEIVGAEQRADFLSR